jgi:hypothetical protein
VLEFLLQGFLLGLAYLAPIGMQNMYVINSAMRMSRPRPSGCLGPRPDCWGRIVIPVAADGGILRVLQGGSRQTHARGIKWLT